MGDLILYAAIFVGGAVVESYLPFAGYVRAAVAWVFRWVRDRFTSNPVP